MGRPKKLKATLPKALEAKPDPSKIEQALAKLTDRQRKAATVLAYGGYQKGTRNQHRQRGYFTLAAKQAGVNHSTLYDWLKKETFMDVIAEVNATIVSELVEAMRREARNGNAALIMYGLSMADPERFDREYKRAITLQERTHKHQREMLALQQQAGAGDPERPLPKFEFVETKPGERRTVTREEDEES